MRVDRLTSMTAVPQPVSPFHNIPFPVQAGCSDDATMTTLKNHLIMLLLSVCGLPSTNAAAQPAEVPMAADRWETVFGTMEFKDYKGTPAMVMTAEGAARVMGLTFTNGTVEFDVEAARMGAGLAFRMQDMQTLELLYFRPQPDCESKPDCVQYAPFTRGVLLWDMLPQYQASAPFRPNEWNHVKMVISGRRMNVFVNGSASPTLKIGSLQGDKQDGQLALVGPGAFAHLKMTPGAVEGLPANAEPDPTADDTRLVRNWQLSTHTELADGVEPTSADIPKAAAEWRDVTAERGGVINISRVYGRPAKPPMRSVTWLKTTITSTKSQTKNVAIGWTREVWVFVNGERVFADKNLYMPASARKPPDGRLSLQNGSLALPLKAGKNEIAVAVANNFYGWGLILRLDDVEGIQLARK
jgi:hypothetical protein